MLGYEVFLELFDGKEFIFYSEIKSFFQMNREGILGIFGFFSIYLYSLSIGSEIYACKPNKEKMYISQLCKGLLRFVNKS